MSQQFQITLQNDRLKLYNRLGWLIIVILILIYSYLGFFSDNGSLKSKAIVFLIAMALGFALKLYFEKTKYRFGAVIFFICLIAAFAANEQYLLTGITFFFQIFHTLSIRPKTLRVSKRGIVYPSFPLKHIQWSQLNNAMLRDGLLTIDFKNDKIIQQMTDEEKSTMNEAEFNEFCNQQLMAAVST